MPKLTRGLGMEVGPQPHHIAMSAGPNHGGRTPIMQQAAPVVPSGITRCGGYLSAGVKTRQDTAAVGTVTGSSGGWTVIFGDRNSEAHRWRPRRL
jgi:hypothetical protein